MVILKEVNIMEYAMVKELSKKIILVISLYTMVLIKLDGQELAIPDYHRIENNPTSIKLETVKYLNNIYKKYDKIKKYFVFAIRVSTDSLNCNYYTVGFVMNESNYKGVNPNYIINDNINMIVVSFDDNVAKFEIPGYDIHKIDESIEKNIMDRLMKEKDGFITGAFNGIILKKCGDMITKTEYDDMGMMPPDRSIFRDFPGNYIIERIRE